MNNITDEKLKMTTKYNEFCAAVDQAGINVNKIKQDLKSKPGTIISLTN